MQGKGKLKEKIVKNDLQKLNKEENYLNIQFNFLKKKTKRRRNEKRKSERSRNKSSSKFVEINTINEKSSNSKEIHSSDFEREVSLNTKKINMANSQNFLKTKINRNINILSDKKEEKIINLKEKEENNDLNSEEEILNYQAKNILKHPRTILQKKINNYINISDVKNSDIDGERNNKFKRKNLTQISINQEKNNRIKKEKKKYHNEKGISKNNTTSINEEI